MEPIIYILITFIAAIIVFAAFGLKIVRHSETMVIERLGKYHRLLESGVNIIWPILDRPRAINCASPTPRWMEHGRWCAIG